MTLAQYLHSIVYEKQKGLVLYFVIHLFNKYINYLSYDIKKEPR